MTAEQAVQGVARLDRQAEYFAGLLDGRLQCCLTVVLRWWQGQFDGDAADVLVVDRGLCGSRVGRRRPGGFYGAGLGTGGDR